jgi:hypothetical protein
MNKGKPDYFLLVPKSIRSEKFYLNFLISSSLLLQVKIIIKSTSKEAFFEMENSLRKGLFDKLAVKSYSN